MKISHVTANYGLHSDVLGDANLAVHALEVTLGRDIDHLFQKSRIYGFIPEACSTCVGDDTVSRTG